MWTERVSVTLPGEAAEQLRELAAAGGRSVSAVAAEAIVEWLASAAAEGAANISRSVGRGRLLGG